MRIGAMSETIQSLYLNPVTRKRSLLFIGKSGVGKSDGVRQAADALAKHPSVDNWQGMIDLRLCQFSATDMSGLPAPDLEQKIVTWLRNEWWPTAKDSSGILFLDELTSAPNSVMASAYQIALDRALGQHELPEGWMVLAAGNRTSDRGVVNAIPSPLLNRFTEVEIHEHIDDTLDFFAVNDRRPEVMAFLKQRADYLHQFGKDYYGKQFPTPRGWFYTSDLLDQSFDQTVRAELIKGTVGEKAATDFEQFLRVYKSMPDIDAILKGKDIPVPSALDVRYCVVMGLAARVGKKNIHLALKWLGGLPKELETLCVKLAYQRDPTLIQAPVFAEWFTANQEVFKR